MSDAKLSPESAETTGGPIMFSMQRGIHSITTVGLSVLVAAIVPIGLTGCAPAVATESTLPANAAPTTTPAPSTTATPSPTPTSMIDPSVLFTVSVTLTAPGKNGAVANLVKTVYKPVPAASVNVSDLALIKKQCDGIIATSQNPTYLKTTVVSTLAEGSSPWPGFDSIGVMEGGGNGSAWSGSYTPFETECEGPRIAIPGEVDGITLIPSVRSAERQTGWSVGLYGFAYFYDVDSFSEIPKSQRYTFSNCLISLNPLAAANPVARKWPTQVSSEPSGKVGRVFGHP